MQLTRHLIPIALFFGLLLLPTLDGLWRFDPAPPPLEHRPLAPAPRWPPALHRLEAFPVAFEAWYNDHFGMRSSAIRLHAWLKAGLFGVSPHPRVVIGREGWLYLGASLTARAGWGVEAGTAPWLDELRARRDWLSARGIPFLVVITPDKGSVYPGHLPWNRVPVRPLPALERLIAALEAERGVEVLDLLPLLRGAAADQQVYHRTDMHWTDAGTHLVYREVLRRLGQWFPGLEPISPERFGPARDEAWAGGLARAMGLEGLYAEQRIRLEPLDRPAARRAELVSRFPQQGGAFEPVVREQPGSGLPRLLMLRDSFARGLIPLLSEHFSRAVYLWQKNLEPELVDEQRPDVVIQELSAFRLVGPVRNY